MSTVDARYFTPQQAAEALAVDVEKILGWIHEGQLRACNVGRKANTLRPRWRIGEADLGRFLLSRQHPAAMQSAPAPRRRKQAGVTEFFK